MSNILRKWSPVFSGCKRCLSSSKGAPSVSNYATAPRLQQVPQRVLKLVSHQADHKPTLPKQYKTPKFPQRVLDSCGTSLREPLPNFPRPKFSRVSHAMQVHEHNITTLSAGVRVATEPQFGEFCTIGVLVNAGSRHEVAYPSGIIHFLEKLAFNSTDNYANQSEIYQVLEGFGGMCDAQDTFIYAASCHNSGVDDVMKVIADVMLRPKFTEEEIQVAQSMVNFDCQDLARSQDCQPLLHDFIHSAAYKENTLGLPKLCPIENVTKITPAVLYSFMKSYFTPERLVIAGVGVDHTKLVEATQKYFVDDAPKWHSHPTILLPKVPSVDQSTAQYTGGSVLLERDLSDVSFGPNPLDEFAHFVLGLESCSYHDPDFVPFCVLSSLMGGGNSFSAGGPGKGMYTRLYTQVLNRHHYMNNARAENYVYADSGIFTIHSSAPPDKLGNVVQVIVEQFLNMAKAPSNEELSRAKKQLQSLLLMQLELRPVMFEDLGKQILGHGTRKLPMQYVEEIEQVTNADIARIGDRLLSSKPSVVGYGKLKGFPDYDRIGKAIATRDLSVLPSSSKIVNLFRRG